jgi:hypothetical protein
MSTTETDAEQQAERATCLFPGCDNLAVEGPKTAVNGRTGPPPRYCEIEEHNAASTFQELKRLEGEGDGGDAA